MLRTAHFLAKEDRCEAHEEHILPYVRYGNVVRPVRVVTTAVRLWKIFEDSKVTKVYRKEINEKRKDMTTSGC